MAQEMLEVRGSRPGGAPVAGDFTLGDVFYFHKKGMESIVDDQVTQRFSSEELASWNLLTRTNQNFRYISLRLTVIWGVGVFVRYCVLFPLRLVREWKKAMIYSGRMASMRDSQMKSFLV